MKKEELNTLANDICNHFMQEADAKVSKLNFNFVKIALCRAAMLADNGDQPTTNQ
jgi:hypothetical protein